MRTKACPKDPVPPVTSIEEFFSMVDRAIFIKEIEMEFHVF
jgi:hypothetical protein